MSPARHRRGCPLCDNSPGEPDIQNKYSELHTENRHDVDPLLGFSSCFCRWLLLFYPSCRYRLGLTYVDLFKVNQAFFQAPPQARGGVICNQPWFLDERSARRSRRQGIVKVFTGPKIPLNHPCEMAGDHHLGVLSCQRLKAGLLDTKEACGRGRKTSTQRPRP